MKKIAFILSVIAVVALSSSCDRCSTCQYKYTMDTVDSVRTFPETCGSKKEVEEYENSVKGESARVGGNVTCEESK